MLPPHANHMGNTFGGCVMEWAEEAALIAARRHVRAAPALAALPGGPLAGPGAGGAGVQLSTAFVEGVSFLRPSTVAEPRILTNIIAECSPV